MKHLTKALGEHSGGKKACYRPPGSSPAETAVFATLGLAALLGIVLAAVWGSVPAGSERAFLAEPPGSAVGKYVRSGQLAADMRTAHSLLLYLLSPDDCGDLKTNEPSL